MPRSESTTITCTRCSGLHERGLDSCPICSGRGWLRDPVGAALTDLEQRRIHSVIIGVGVGAYATMFGTQISPIDAFHAHLDSCARCRHNPHNLCRIGAARLERGALGSVPSLSTFATGKEI